MRNMRWARVRLPPPALDAALALAFAAVSLLLGQKPPPLAGWHGLNAYGDVLTLLVNLPIAARSRAPVAVIVFVCGMWAVFVAAGYWPVVNCLAPLLALYTVASLRSLRVAVGCALIMSSVWWYAGATARETSMVTYVAQSILFSAVMIRFGVAARVSAKRADQLAAMAERLRAEQEDRARRAVVEEQGRIARELHDVVAHHMSVISVQAGMAGYVFTSDPATARGALRTISATTREALQEMRRMLKVLRADEDEPDGGSASYDPMPSVAALGEMVERIRSAGVDVNLRITGEPRPLAPGVGLCAYRVVQEALTNVLKHTSPAARATVLVDYLPHHLAVSVTDDGSPPDPATPAGATAGIQPTGGHGLIGMRERARLYGGTVTIGPRAEGGFGVHLTLPTSAREVRDVQRRED
ncbi:sensor histidine kinase [Streptomyces mirabilis]|uniref:sensor histidine kinase n=1 Tax=Streptomyces mirabilis TaxID=68239 RepID=UPI003658FBF7